MKHRRCDIVGSLLLLSILFAGRRIGATAATIRSRSNDNDDDNNSIVFPTVQETWDMVFLSNAVYDFVGSSSCEDASTETVLGDKFFCEYYEDSKQDTQVLVVTSRSDTGGDDYVAVVYAGTDDWRNWATDSNTWKTRFGAHSSTNRTVAPSPDIAIHQGFDYAVFGEGVYDRVEQVTLDLLDQGTYQNRLFLTGHSLGGADAVITAMAIHPKLQARGISTRVLNFGCPRIGNDHWQQWVNSQTHLGLNIWRFVNGNDIVTRMPQFMFQHVGHTVQLNRKSTAAYYLHHGGGNYSGVPFGWSTKPFAFLPLSAIAHHILHYVNYIHDKSLTDPENHYFSHFEYKKKEEGEEEEDNNDDDDDGEEHSLPKIFGQLKEDVQHHAAVAEE